MNAGLLGLIFGAMGFGADERGGRVFRGGGKINKHTIRQQTSNWPNRAKHRAKNKAASKARQEQRRRGLQ